MEINYFSCLISFCVICDVVRYSKNLKGKPTIVANEIPKIPRCPAVEHRTGYSSINTAVCACSDGVCFGAVLGFGEWGGGGDE